MKFNPTNISVCWIQTCFHPVDQSFTSYRLFICHISANPGLGLDTPLYLVLLLILKLIYFILRYREGSTVAVYSLRAPAIDDDQVKRVKSAVFNELAAKNYPMEFVSKKGPISLGHT